MSFEGQDIESYGGEEDGHRKRDTSRKRDGKRDKKEKGYTMFEEEDSEEDNLVTPEDVKSPSKTKKDKGKPSFKFPVRKEKVRDKEEKKDKDAKKEEKEKRKEEKEGKKMKKDKKKSKHVHHEPPSFAPTPSNYENPIFGVPLAVAVERNKSHDGIELPAIFRECVDYIEECGLTCEGIYRISGVKSKVQALKDSYNRHQPIYLHEHEPNIVASLLKQFLRDLPEPVLTPTLMPKFEEASTAKSNRKKVELFAKLIADLPACNRLLLSWMIVHMTHVIDLAKENKMTLQNVSIVLSPTMKISHRVLNVLFSNAHNLFGDIQLRKYVPPLKPAHSKWSLELPDNAQALEEELAKQESLLNQLHADLNSGLTDPVIEEQLWEVQRVVTQLKRKIKLAKKGTEVGERRWTHHEAKRYSNSSLPSLSAPEELHLQLRTVPEPNNTPTLPPQESLPDSEKSAAEEKEETAPDENVKNVKFASEEKIKTKEEESKTDTTETSVEAAEMKVDDGDKKNVTDDEVKQQAIESASTSTETTNKDKTLEESKEITESKETALKTEVSSHGQGEVKKNNQEENVPVTTEERTLVVKLDESPVVTKPPETEDKVKEFVSNNGKDEENIPDERKTSATMPDETASSEKSVAAETDQETVSSTAVGQSNIDEAVADLNSVPPFMSLTLLEPVKAVIPKPKETAIDNNEEREILRKSEELRELEEEFLGEKEKKVVAKASEEEESTTDHEIDDAELEGLLEEEYALIMEEEELRAIEDELRQKIATERSEMERLTQEIQELQYLRQDSDLEDLSSDSNSSDESEDEDDLQDLLTQIIKENECLEMQNADLCQKIHEERMICLSVKLQIRLLQQKQLETSYG